MSLDQIIFDLRSSRNIIGIRISTVAVHCSHNLLACWSEWWFKSKHDNFMAQVYSIDDIIAASSDTYYWGTQRWSGSTGSTSTSHGIVPVDHFTLYGVTLLRPVYISLDVLDSQSFIDRLWCMNNIGLKWFILRFKNISIYEFSHND